MTSQSRASPSAPTFKIDPTRLTNLPSFFHIFQAALWDNYELLVDVLEAESHLVNCRDSWGRTPLHASAITADSKCMLILISHGTDINAEAGPREDKKTPLHISAEHGHASNVRVLLDAGASYLVKDANGLTPLDLADRGGQHECVQRLRDAAGKLSNLS